MHFGNSEGNFGSSAVVPGTILQPECQNWLHFYRIPFRLPISVGDLVGKCFEIEVLYLSSDYVIASHRVPC